jgi:hypothetical protein
MHLYDVDEANALLPELTQILERLRVANETLVSTHQGLVAAAPRNGGGHPGLKLLHAAQECADCLGKLNEWDVLLRDPETGLVDFPAERDDEPIFLCWRLGEPEVAWWHPTDTGVAGREPL